MKNLLIFVFSAFFFFNIYAQNPSIDKLNKQIERTLFTSPDSAKVYILRLLKHSAELQDTTLAKAYSNLGIQYNKLAVPDSAEFYMKKALPFATENPKIQGRMYLNLGINYRIGSRYAESIEALNSAICLFKEAAYPEGVGIALGEMGSNYNYMLNSEKALESLKKSIDILTETKNTRDLNIVKQKLANLYYNNANYVFARALYEEVLPFFAQTKGANYYYTLLSYADCLVRLEEDYQAAEEALDSALVALNALKNYEMVWVANSNLAKIYSVTGRTQLAQQAYKDAYEGSFELNSPRFMEIGVQYLSFLNSQKLYNQALSVVTRLKSSVKNSRLRMNSENEVTFLKESVKTYSKLGNTENSLEAFERMDFLKDSLNTAINYAKSLELQQAYQNELQLEKNRVLEKNNELLKENNYKKDKIIVLSVLSLILLMAIGILGFFANRNKLKLQRELVSNLEDSKKVLEAKNKLESELLLEREGKLAHKEKELVQVTLEVSNLKSKIMELIDNRENPKESEALSVALKNLLGNHNYWKHFKNKFVEVHPVFASMLIEMFPQLSDNDIAFCCMLKLQLSSQEIAPLMGITTESVDFKKIEIRRKIGMEHDILGFEKLIDHLE